MAPARTTTLVFVLLAASLACAAAASDRDTPSYKTWEDAIKATTNSPVTTLIAAVKAAGLATSLKPGTKWTILAPTNAAFEKRLKALGLTAAALLENKELLTKVLSYHVIPAGAVASSALKNGQEVKTALAGAAPLTVKLSESKGVVFKGAGSKARVVTADIKVGSSIIHVIDDVLIPEGVGGAKAKTAQEKGAGDKKATASAAVKP